MTLPLILAALVALAAIFALAVLTAQSRAMPGPSMAGKTVVVNTRRPDDQTFRGVVVGDHADRLILREAVVLHSGGGTDLAGLVHLDRIGISTVVEIEPALEPRAVTATVLDE